MTPLPIEPPAELPLWKGRRGVINTVMCCVLALPCAYALWAFAERSVIVPVCTAYASAHGLTYTDFKLTGVKQADTVVCLFARANGASQEVHLNELVSFFTDAWVGFALSLEITIPAFAVLLALVRVALYRRTTAAA